MQTFITAYACLAVATLSLRLSQGLGFSGATLAAVIWPIDVTVGWLELLHEGHHHPRNR